MRRSSWLVLSVCFFSSIAVPLATVSAQDGAPRRLVAWTHLSGPLHKLTCNDNVAVIASVGEDGVLLVDTGYGGTVEDLQRTIDEFERGPVRFIVNTHGDGDHVGGNAALGEDAVILSHPAVREQLGTYFALPAADTEGMPTVTLGGEATIHFNGDEIRLLPIAGGHTRADLVVHFTESGVACVGDLILEGTFANADPGRGGDAQRLAEVLRTLLEILPADTHVVPGHGDDLTMDGVRSYLEMVEGTVEAVRKEVIAGRGLDEILERNPLAPWAEWEDADFGVTIENWTREIQASLVGGVRRSVCEPLTEVLVEEGVEAAAAEYRRLVSEEPESWNFAENQLNALGYQLLAREMLDEAIAIFELNVEAYPEAGNVYDSLGEAYMTAGRTELAIANYERSLELDPGNDNAVAMLARLRGE